MVVFLRLLSLSIFFWSQGKTFGSMNTTVTDLSGKEPLGQDVFRQLLNQETLIRMSMVKNVHSLMQDMVSQKDSTVKLQNIVNKLSILLEEEKTSRQTEIKELKSENQKLKETIEKMDKVLSELNQTDARLETDINKVWDDQKQFVKDMNASQESSTRKTNNVLSDLKVELRLLSMSVLNVDKRSQDLNKRLDNVDKTIPKQIEEKYHVVSAMAKNLSEHLSEETNNTLSNMRSELEDTKQSQLKISAAVLSLEWFKNNISRGNCDLSKRIGFTAGVSSSGRSWSSGKLIFTKVLYNQGNGYDSASGVFTAPSAGMYVFYVSITSYSSNTISVDIILNGYSQVTARANGGSGSLYTGYGSSDYSYPYQSGTNMAVLSLKRGDRVWTGYKSGTGYYTDSTPITTFSGFLI
ncbi:uncharacterized protein LOC133185171 [Saccostrea echinata]|uniref:uncharacterized protein LOC133185171 n=1 Tax=Saccostrea echinata TaxID=191078 RepID=UPI002A813451|nr:uncharacterized protein LOC133185171 [Saccostrea echinata]